MRPRRVFFPLLFVPPQKMQNLKNNRLLLLNIHDMGFDFICQCWRRAAFSCRRLNPQANASAQAFTAAGSKRTRPPFHRQGRRCPGRAGRGGGMPSLDYVGHGKDSGLWKNFFPRGPQFPGRPSSRGAVPLSPPAAMENRPFQNQVTSSGMGLISPFSTG